MLRGSIFPEGFETFVFKYFVNVSTENLGKVFYK